MKHPRLSDRDRAQAQRASLRWAGQVRSTAWDATWVAPTTKRLWPTGAGDLLTEITESADGPERDGARLLLRAMRRAERAERRNSRHGNQPCHRRARRRAEMSSLARARLTRSQPGAGEDTGPDPRLRSWR